MAFIERCPVFLDIFVFDYVDDASTQTWGTYENIRSSFIEDSISLVNSLPNGTKLTTSSEVNNLINQYIKLTSVKLASVGCCNGIIWGVDNFTCRTRFLINKDIVFPIKHTNLRGVDCCIPNDPHALLSLNYGQILRYPSDAYLHVHHNLEDTRILDAFLDKYQIV